MSTKSLKKLVLRKDIALVTDVIESIDERLCLISEQGAYLLGNRETFDATEVPHRVAVTLESETIGWVCGGPKAEVAAQLLSNLACRNFEKRKITEELLDKYKEITLLFRLSEQIVETIDIDKIAQLVLSEAQQALPSDSGSLLLLHETTNTLESLASFGECKNSNNQSQTTIQIGEGLVGQIAAASRGEIVNDVDADPRSREKRFFEAAVENRGERQQSGTALICVPLKIKSRLIGVIVLYRLQPYRAEDLKLLTTLGSHTASVIGVLNNEKQLRESRQNEIVFQLSSQIRNSLNLSDTLQTAVHKIQAVLQTDRCFFLWHRSGEDTLLSPALAGQQLLVEHFAIISEAKNPALPSIAGVYSTEELGGRLLQAPLHQQEVIKIDDVGQLEPSAVLGRFLQQNNCESLLAFPLNTRAGQTGLLCCSSSRPRLWESEEVELLRAVSSQLIIAINQAELYEQSLSAMQVAQEKAQVTEQTLNELRKVQIQLVQTEKMSSLGQMVAGIAHEINNPVNFIHGNLFHLEQNVKDLLHLIRCYQQEMDEPTEPIQAAIEDINLAFLSEDLPKLLESMTIGTQRIREITTSLKTFSQLDQSEIKQVDIHQGLNSALLLVQHRFRQQESSQNAGPLQVGPLQHDQPDITLVKNYGQIPPFCCYARELNQVFAHLLNNGLDALETSNKEARLLSITTETDGAQAVIRIADNGPGISPDVQHRIFDPFFTTKKVGQGTGMGLSISYQIITQRHQGSLECHTEVGKGCEFIITVPIHLSCSPKKQDRLASIP